DGKVFQITAEGKAPTSLPFPKVSLFRVSPDGRVIAAVSEGSEKSTLHFHTRGAARAPIEVAGVVLSAEWMPSGGDLLLTVGSADGIHLQRVASGTLQKVSPAEGLAFLTD